jgi:hypothetical protein
MPVIIERYDSREVNRRILEKSEKNQARSAADGRRVGNMAAGAFPVQDVMNLMHAEASRRRP